MKENQVDKKIREGYKLDMGLCMDKSIEYFKKTIWISGLAIILSVIFISVIGAIIGATVSIGTNFLGDLEGLLQDPNKLLFSTFGIVSMIIGLISASLITPLYAGFINLNHLAAQKKELNFGDLFIFYKNGKTKDLILKGLIVGFTVQVISICFVLLGLDFIGNLVQYFITTVVLFATPLIIYFNLNYSQALEKSIPLILKRFFPIFLLMLLSGIFAMVGLLALCIGIFFTLPFMFSMQYAIFGEVFDLLDEKSEIDEIGEHNYNS